MSLNLCFITKNGAGVINLPFTTPTDISIGVLAAGTIEERIAILKEYLIQSDWENVSKTIELIENHLSDPTLELSFI